jgi:membrane protein required for colicin V production
MSFLDIILGLLIVWGLFNGIRNGLLVELASIIALIAGLYGAIHFSYIVGDYLSANMEWDGKYIPLIAFLITFGIIIVVVSLVGRLLTKIADFVLLGLLNRIAGGIFGALKVAVLLGALLVFFDGTNERTGIIKKETLEKSMLYTPLKEIGAFIFGRVLKEYPLGEKETIVI